MFRFVDLFAGLGGFHVALSQLGGQCVYACEIDDSLRELYLRNFEVKADADIRRAKPVEIPDHDVLCAGFPCQSFSKAGAQEGLDCERNGDLIDFVQAIITAKRPRVIMLENVPNLMKHAGGATWEGILAKLKKEYEVNFEVLSPDEFGIPQVRDRVFIVGARLDQGGLGMFSFPEPTMETPNLRLILQKEPDEAKPLTPRMIHVIDTWNQFLAAFPKDTELPSFPIWAMEFGATYPIDGKTPLKRTLKEMQTYKGMFGTNLSHVRTKQELAQHLPHHALGDAPFPRWKQAFILQSRKLWETHKSWIKGWLPNILGFPHSFQKLEWNCKGCERDLWKHVLQIRASGLRAKRPTTAPSLIAMTTTQVPIIAWEKRFMTARECAALQTMESLKHLPSTPNRSYKALGNAVNAKLVRMVAERLLKATELMAAEAPEYGSRTAEECLMN